MKRFALLSSLCLFAGLSVAHASALNPLADGYGITVGSTTLSSTNVTSTSNGLSFTDATGTYVFAEVNASPWVNALSITRACAIVNVGQTCAQQTISVSNATLLNGLLTAQLAAGVSATAGAQADVTNLVFASSLVNIGAQTAIVGTQSSSTLPVNSPVPEPGTISLVLSGALGVAAAARRRLLGA